MSLFGVRESAAMALRSIKGNAGRSFLTTLGVLIGAGALVALTALGNGASLAVEESLRSLGSNLLIVYSGQPRGTALVRRNTSTITPADVETWRMVAALGSKAAADLFGPEADPLGQRVRLNGQPFTVVAVMQSKGNDTTDNQVYVPISAFLRVIVGGTKYQAVNVQAESMAAFREVQSAVESELLRLHGLPSMDAADFYIANQLDVLGAAQGTAGTFTVLLGGIAAISLIVGGIGTMNIMLVSVTERTREIGVRMALGAKPGDVLMQFLTEAVILSASGGALGVAAGIGAAWAFGRFGGMASAVSPGSVALALGFSLVTGLFFGGYPAFRASRLDPIEALRYE